MLSTFVELLLTLGFTYSRKIRCKNCLAICMPWSLLHSTAQNYHKSAYGLILIQRIERNPINISQYWGEYGRYDDMYIFMSIYLHSLIAEAGSVRPHTFHSLPLSCYLSLALPLSPLMFLCSLTSSWCEWADTHSPSEHELATDYDKMSDTV